MRTLLIDSDIPAYQVASACQTVAEWEEWLHTSWYDPREVTETFDSQVKDLMAELDATDVVMAVTSKTNFRHKVLPSYKGNRKGTQKPIALGHLRKHIHESYITFERDGLEADDCLGILATMDTEKYGERIVVSLDKDLQQIPGLVFRPGKDTKPQLISESEGDWWHMYQTLTGDVTDGYSGCPGIGPVKAEKILNEAAELWAKAAPHPTVLTIEHYQWDAVCQAYEKAKLGEEEALRQARVARILRASDYCFETKQPKLWSPS